jgi:hypothetical protein
MRLQVFLVVQAVVEQTWAQALLRQERELRVKETREELPEGSTPVRFLTAVGVALMLLVVAQHQTLLPELGVPEEVLQ